MERSAVFMVAMIQRLSGRPKRAITVLLVVGSILQPDAVVPILEEVVELAEDLCHVPSVQLVDDEYEDVVLVGLGSACQTPERSFNELEARLGCYERRTVALDEVLV